MSWGGWPRSRPRYGNLYPTAEDRSHDHVLPQPSSSKKEKRINRKDQRIWVVKIIETDGASIFSHYLTYLEAKEMKAKVLKKLESISVKRKCTVVKSKGAGNYANDYFDYLLDIQREVTNPLYGDLSHDQANYLDGILRKQLT